jgi:hypothetical protein
MTSTGMGNESRTGAVGRYDRGDNGDRDDRNRSVRMLTATETRRSFITSEFWLTLVAAVAVIIAGYWDEANLEVGLAWSLGIGLVAAYVLSRGVAKAGSRDPEVRDLR